MSFLYFLYMFLRLYGIIIAKYVCGFHSTGKVIDFHQLRWQFILQYSTIWTQRSQQHNRWQNKGRKKNLSTKERNEKRQTLARSNKRANKLDLKLHLTFHSPFLGGPTFHNATISKFIKKKKSYWNYLNLAPNSIFFPATSTFHTLYAKRLLKARRQRQPIL